MLGTVSLTGFPKFHKLLKEETVLDMLIIAILVLA